jgi:hypothetical protein
VRSFSTKTRTDSATSGDPKDFSSGSPRNFIELLATVVYVPFTYAAPLAVKGLTCWSLALFS